MSVEAYVWALNLAPVPMEVKGRGRPPKDGRERPAQPSSTCAFVLVALANHADPAGRDAFPSVETLMRYTRLGERTVRAALDRLEAAGVIRPSDPAVLAAKIKRADRRPQGWDLNMRLIRDDLTREQLLKIGKDSPFLAAHIDAHLAACAAVAEVEDPWATVTEPVDVNDRFSHGVQSLQERGAVVSGRGAVTAPEPSLNRPLEPSNGQDTGLRDRRHAEAAGPKTTRRSSRPISGQHLETAWAQMKEQCTETGDDPWDVWHTLLHREQAHNPAAWMARLLDDGTWDGYCGSNGIDDYSHLKRRNA